MHRSKLLGAPLFDDVKRRDQFIYKKTGEAYKTVTLIGLIFLALFIGLMIGATIIGFISRSKITFRSQGIEQERENIETNLEHLAPVVPRSSGSISLLTMDTVQISSTKVNQNDKEFKPYNWGLDNWGDSKDDQL